MSSQTNKPSAPTSILKGSSNNPSQVYEPNPKLNVNFCAEKDTVITIPSADTGHPVMHLKDCPKHQLFDEGFSTVWKKMLVVESGVSVPKPDTSSDEEVVVPRKKLNYEELMALPDDERAMVILTEPFEETAKRLRDHIEKSK
jgi:hypothetical protein